MRRQLITALIVCCVGEVVGRADIVTYTVNPAASNLTLSGSFGNLPLKTQYPDGVNINSIPDLRSYKPSLSTFFGGTIQINQDTNQGTIEFAGGQISALTSGNWYGNGDDRMPANYGFSAVGDSIPGLAGMNGLFSNFTFGLRSAPISADSANASPVTVSGASGEFSYALYYNSNTYPVNTQITYASVGLGGPIELQPGNVVFSEVDGVHGITIPMSGDFVVTAVPGFPLNVHLSGVLVATADSDQTASAVPAPEPSTCLLLGITACLLLRRRQGVRSV